MVVPVFEFRSEDSLTIAQYCLFGVNGRVRAPGKAAVQTVMAYSALISAYNFFGEEVSTYSMGTREHLRECTAKWNNAREMNSTRLAIQKVLGVCLGRGKPDADYYMKNAM